MERLKDYFDRRASLWDEMLNYNKKTSELSEVVNCFGLAEGDWVLDVGTGTGILLPLITQAIGGVGATSACLHEAFRRRQVVLNREDFGVSSVER